MRGLFVVQRVSRRHFYGRHGVARAGLGACLHRHHYKTEVFSLIIGGLFVAEACSVILQVVHYKRTKKRLFLMAPLHHHFEKKGWSETKVVIRFWIVSGALAGFGFVLFFIQPIVMGMVA